MTKGTGLLAKIKPTSGYVLIEPEEATKQTSSGIYLPDSATGDKPQQGQVLAVGPDEITEKGVSRKSPAKAGAKVIYKKWGGNEVKIDNKEYLFVKFEDILAVVS
jgi:chaperonin GroES